MGTIAKPPLWRISGLQLLALSVLSAGLLPLGPVQSYSLLAGGLIHIAGTAYFASLAFRHQGARQLGRTVRSMYRGETGKIMLSALFFIAVFLFVKPLGVFAFFCGYGAMVVVHAWIAARLLQRRPQGG
ncbi:MAG: ATP synthase subunit I [Porticoccaceae bacterium]|nr:ATP synthase subunit I [Porticoccaceae bacterium]MEA3300547.1 ATP synthase subunit I [Pseudomonadota bacterium]HLS97178.1 ATP synthase subunit I [Porticoccaceae bacterium]